MSALQKFYSDVLPPDVSGARRITFLRLAQLATQADLRLERGTNLESTAAEATATWSSSRHLRADGGVRDVRPLHLRARNRAGIHRARERRADSDRGRRERGLSGHARRSRLTIRTAAMAADASVAPRGRGRALLVALAVAVVVLAGLVDVWPVGHARGSGPSKPGEQRPGQVRRRPHRALCTCGWAT